MAYVVTESCVRCKYMDCVEVCPVDCFHEGLNMLVINPDECIDCNLCVPECPAEAIFSEYDLPQDQIEFKEYNKNKSQVWPIIRLKKQPYNKAEEFKNIKDKKQYLSENE